MNDLDRSLVEQLIAARERLKAVHRLRKMLPNDPSLDDAEHFIKERIKLLEYWVKDKRLLKKKRISITRTLTKVVYMVRFMFVFKHLLTRKKEK